MLDPAIAEAQAVAYAKLYVRLAAALMREGVPEDIARTEARMTSTAWLMEEMEIERYASAPCPVCGQSS